MLNVELQLDLTPRRTELKAGIHTGSCAVVFMTANGPSDDWINRM
jgi:hypothetical protein